MSGFLDRFSTEKLILHKQLGTTYEVQGLFSKVNEISSDDISIPIECNDCFERELPNGQIEFYKVVEPGYVKGMGGIPDHFQTKVQRTSSPIIHEQSKEFSMKFKRGDVFISHRSVDKDIVDILKDFLVSTGIPNEKIFCSSLPGNDIVFRISTEVKRKLQQSIVNILILSKDYYESAYCLNEAGIAWYLEDEVCSIAVCLPEIDNNNMKGFFSGENKVRRLDNENDVAAIYDIIRKKLNVPGADFGVVTRERQKLARRYAQCIEERTKSKISEENDEEALDIGRHDNFSGPPFVYQPIQLYASIMLFLTAEDDGIIIASRTMGGTKYLVGGNSLNKSGDPRELAKWEDALEQLLQAGYVKQTGTKGDIFRVTNKGYMIADAFKNDNQLDSNITLDEVLSMFELE